MRKSNLPLQLPRFGTSWMLPTKSSSRGVRTAVLEISSTRLWLGFWKGKNNLLKYHKMRNIWTPEKLAVIIIKLEHGRFTIWASSSENLLLPYANNTVVRGLDSIKPLLDISKISLLDSFWSWAGRFESYLVANLRRQFFRDQAHTMHSKDANRAPNSVDSVGAVWSESKLFAQTCLPENLGSLWY